MKAYTLTSLAVAIYVRSCKLDAVGGIRTHEPCDTIARSKGGCLNPLSHHGIANLYSVHTEL